MILSAGILPAFAVSTANRKRGLKAGSPPPSLAATVISLMSLVNTLPRFASVTAFFLLIVAHLLCPDTISSLVKPEMNFHCY